MQKGLAVLLVLVPAVAEASYSPPLTRVRIDEDRISYTPALFYVEDRQRGVVLDSVLRTYGVQFLLQKEWENGWGLFAGVAIARAQVAGTLVYEDHDAPLSDSNGILAGGQVRGYYMVYQGGSSGRPHALTLFADARVIQYQTGADVGRDRLKLTTLGVQAGIGAMGEIAVWDYVSVLPFAWVSSTIFRKRTYEYGPMEREEVAKLSFRQPVKAGVDVWVYPWGASDESHISLAVLASLFDTEGWNHEYNFVVGYTF